MEVVIALSIITFAFFYLASQFDRKEHPGLQFFWLIMGISITIIGFSTMATVSMEQYVDTRQNATPLVNQPFDLRGDLDVVIEDVQVYNKTGPPGNLVTERGFIDNSNYTVTNNNFVLLDEKLNNTKMNIIFSHRKQNSNSDLMFSGMWVSILILIVMIFYFVIFLIKNIWENIASNA